MPVAGMQLAKNNQWADISENYRKSPHSSPYLLPWEQPASKDWSVQGHRSLALSPQLRKTLDSYPVSELIMGLAEVFFESASQLNFFFPKVCLYPL